MKSPYRNQLIYLSIAAFFGIFAYPFTRTSAAPFFNAAYGADKLPYAMIASALLALVVVAIYNELAKKFKLLPLATACSMVIIVVNAAFGFLMSDPPKWMTLLYYSWSDVYILILAEQHWSISNTIFDKKSAKKYYGIFLFFSAVGGLAGNALVAALAESVGSSRLIFLSSAAIVAFAASVWMIYRSTLKDEFLNDKFMIEQQIAQESLVGGSSLVFKSNYLLLLMLMSIATQIYINSVYFVYNQMLDQSVHKLDMQSAIYGKVFSIVQAITIINSLLLTPMSLKFLGVAKTHYTIVTTMLLVFAVSVINPAMALVAVFFVLSKSFDYSVYRAAKEMFYLPLSVAEKYQAKAFIDVFIYRISKAASAFGIIFISDILKQSVYILIGLAMVTWFVAVYFILRIYKRMRVRRTEPAPVIA